ncbi:hypothetical protein IAI10_19745 [Clostridium sp. 19966]|uniref:hypothetical protein n=1 Tax=Clostridium sp. 19966 TaxID=2768166 RepID=UPI0028DE0927|nr:hypothetical protein [Clostridium sp. 19966]MDT8718889.1 hypothetical protein [Clostridium sp. 19966]
MNFNNLEAYYKVDTVATLFKVSIQTVIDKIRNRADYAGKWITFDGSYYIDKFYIDKIINDRIISMNIKDTSLAIHRSIDATRDILNSGRLDFFIDKWNGTYRVYKVDIDKFVDYKESCFTAEELGHYFRIGANNIRKKILYNYCNINDFLVRPHPNKIYIRKVFLEYLKEVENSSFFLEKVAYELKIKQKDLLSLCLNYYESKIFKDFVTGKYRIMKECVAELKERANKNETIDKNVYVKLNMLLREWAMNKEEFINFALEECNIDIYSSMKDIKTNKLIPIDVTNQITYKLDDYYSKKSKLEFMNDKHEMVKQNDKFDTNLFISPEELASEFGISTIVIMRRIRKNYCQAKEYIKINERKFFINKSFLYYLKEIVANSILFDKAAKQLNISWQSLEQRCMQLSSESIFKDFLTGRFRIKNEYFAIIKGENLKERKPKIINKNKKNIVKDKNLNTEIREQEKRYISLKKISNQFGISTDIIRERIKRNYCGVQEYINSNKNKRLIRKEFFIDLKEIEANSILIHEAAKQLKISQCKLEEKCMQLSRKSIFKDFMTGRFRIRNEYFEVIKETILVDKKLAKKILADKKLTKKISSQERYLKENGYDINELAVIFGISATVVRERIRENCGSVRKFVISGKREKIYVNKNFVDYTEEINNNSILVKDLSERLNINEINLIGILSREKNDILVADFATKKLLIKNEYLQEVNTLINTENEKHGQYLGIEIAANILGTSVTIIKKIINEGLNCIHYEIDGKLYVSKEFIYEKLNLINNTVSSEEAASIIGVPRHIVLEACRYECIKLIKNPICCFKYRIEKDKIDAISKSIRIGLYRKRVLLDKLCKLAKNEFDLFDKIKNGILLKQELKETIDLYCAFAYERIGDSEAREKSKYIIAKKCGNLLEFLNRMLYKNIYVYSNEEIDELLDKVENSAHIKVFNAFLAYCKGNIECKFNSDYSCSEISLKADSLNTEDIYSLEEWRKYTLYLTDIDVHIIKAFNSPKYACTWLLCILHLILPWRLNDIVSKLPNIEIEQIGIENFRWFENGNEFTLSMGQKILNQLEFKISGINTNKNDEELRVFTSINLIVPISVAYVIAEIHRRENKDLQVLSKLMDERYKNEVGTWVRKAIKNFCLEVGLDNFLNRRANSSLLTYTYECANTMEGMKGISYILEGAARSHKNDKKILLPTSTQIYLKPILHNEDAKSIAYNLVQRGFFGWMPYMLLRIAYDDSYEDMKVFDMTDAIVRLKSNYSLIGLESIAEHISSELYMKTQTKIFHELISLDKAELKERVKSLLTYESASKSKYGGCIKGKICKHAKRSSCTCCDYFAKNIYFLTSLNQEIKATMEVIANTNENKYYELIKNTTVLVKLFSVVTEAKLFYQEYDSKIADTFIDTEFINKKLGEIKGKLRVVK